MFGGNANNGTNAGLTYANSNNVPSNANANIGSHLCFKADFYFTMIYNPGMTSPLGEKYITFERVLVETSVVWTIEGSRIEKQSEL